MTPSQDRYLRGKCVHEWLRVGVHLHTTNCLQKHSLKHFKLALISVCGENVNIGVWVCVNEPISLILMQVILNFIQSQVNLLSLNLKKTNGKMVFTKEPHLGAYKSDRAAIVLPTVPNLNWINKVLLKETFAAMGCFCVCRNTCNTQPNATKQERTTTFLGTNGRHSGEMLLI